MLRETSFQHFNIKYPTIYNTLFLFDSNRHNNEIFQTTEIQYTNTGSANNGSNLDLKELNLNT